MVRDFSSKKARTGLSESVYHSHRRLSYDSRLAESLSLGASKLELALYVKVRARVFGI